MQKGEKGKVGGFGWRIIIIIINGMRSGGVKWEKIWKSGLRRKQGKRSKRPLCLNFLSLR